MKVNITIGAGSVVTKDIQESGVYVGVPARRIKYIEIKKQLYFLKNGILYNNIKIQISW